MSARLPAVYVARIGFGNEVFSRSLWAGSPLDCPANHRWNGRSWVCNFLAMVSCSLLGHNGDRCPCIVILPAVRSAPGHDLVEELGSVITCCPTMRAPDLGYAPRFLSFFLTLTDSRFEGESTLPPQAGNASRWAAEYTGSRNLWEG